MKKFMVPLAAVFILVSIIVLAASGWLQQKGVDTVVVLVGNAILFLVSALAYMLYAKALNSKKGYGFVQQVYGGFTLKFFALVVGAMLYFYFAKEVNKPAIFICMGLYLVYNFLGTSQVVRKNPPPQKNADHHHSTHHSKQHHPHH
ncbi:MAG TPA: hypothetical protein VLC98_00670 [Phnomibacter sp.]|nr:hypothetical protein [Phnomibacter sp.]